MRILLIIMALFTISNAEMKLTEIEIWDPIDKLVSVSYEDNNSLTGCGDNLTIDRPSIRDFYLDIITKWRKYDKEIKDSNIKNKAKIMFEVQPYYSTLVVKYHISCGISYLEIYNKENKLRKQYILSEKDVDLFEIELNKYEQYCKNAFKNLG